MSRVRGKRNKEAWFRNNVFDIQNFQTLWNLEKKLVSTKTNVSELLSILLKLFFAKSLTYYKANEKGAIAMPLHQMYCLSSFTCSIKKSCS